MKTVLFCQNNYAYGILDPIKDILQQKSYPFIWYITDKLLKNFPYKKDPYTSSILELKKFNSDVIFVPGNEVPYYLRGLKVQVFHGLAGEKKGHFRIRDYFDVYLTQGPYFTRVFNKLKKKHKDFDVYETGWPKLDVYYQNKTKLEKDKKSLLSKNEANYLLLYAPTFSPNLTSAPYLTAEIAELAENRDYIIYIKFHPLMDLKWVQAYKKISKRFDNIIFVDDTNITNLLIKADILISDTSSVIYEFLLLNKPAITFKNISKKILWSNSENYNDLISLVRDNILKDPYKQERKKVFEEYHPYSDGKSALRMVEVAKKYISDNGVPEKRKLNLYRRLKIKSIFGSPN